MLAPSARRSRLVLTNGVQGRRADGGAQGELGLATLRSGGLSEIHLLERSSSFS